MKLVLLLEKRREVERVEKPKGEVGRGKEIKHAVSCFRNTKGEGSGEMRTQGLKKGPCGFHWSTEAQKREGKVWNEPL